MSNVRPGFEPLADQLKGTALVLSLLPLVLMPCLYAAMVKLAALLYRRTRLQWKHAFVYALLAVVVGMVAVGLHRASGLILPLPLAVLLSLVLQVVLGAWFFATRAFAESGDPLKLRGAAVITLIAFGLMSAFVLVVAAGLPLVIHGGEA